MTPTEDQGDYVFPDWQKFSNMPWKGRVSSPEFNEELDRRLVQEAVEKTVHDGVVRSASVGTSDLSRHTVEDAKNIWGGMFNHRRAGNTGPDPFFIATQHPDYIAEMAEEMNAGIFWEEYQRYVFRQMMPWIHEQIQSVSKQWNDGSWDGSYPFDTK